MRNPATGCYEIVIKNPEVTFLGAEGQPDIATVTISFTPGERVIELRSLKRYFVQFRERVLSYERIINVIYGDLVERYKPTHIRVTMTCRPRGGISSKLTIDSNNR